MPLMRQILGWRTLAVAGATVLATQAAEAASPCGSSYVMQPGDTLYKVTQQCRVKLSSLIRANPSIDDIHDIAVGTRLDMPGARAGRSDGRRESAQRNRTVEPGETFFSIAEELGVSVRALIEANPGLDPADLRIGARIRIPGLPGGGRDDGRDRRATISVQPRAGAPGTPVTVRGSGYRPGERVTIGAGPPQSEWTRRETARVRQDGTVSAQVTIPDWAEPGQEIVFVIDSRSHRTQVSRRVDVVAARDPDAPRDGRRGGTFVGRVSEGAECPVLTTRSGRRYALAGARGRVAPGDYVRVHGTLADVSFCMEGSGTISVERVASLRPRTR